MILVNILVLLVRGEPANEILLGIKKAGFGEGKYVGVGGTVEAGETLVETAVREVGEEAGVRVAPEDLKNAARITFVFPNKPEWDRMVYVFLAEKWQGEPRESDEIKPEWFRVDEIPYNAMWADAAHWLPEVLAGRELAARFVFDDDNEVLKEIVLNDRKDTVWPQVKALPYFRGLLRAVESSYYQDMALPEPVLDVGSGDGHFASETFEHKLNVGLDPWWEPLLESKRFGAYNGLVQADGAEMPFPTASFASAVSNSVLEHIPQLNAVLAETARVLKRGAPFIFCVPNPGYFSELSVPATLGKIGLRGLGRAYGRWFGEMSRTYNALPPEEWAARLGKAGFALERWWHYFSPSALHALEWGHYFGAPSLLPRRLTGRWLLAPTRWNLALTERLVRRYASDQPIENGTYTFYEARRK